MSFRDWAVWQLDWPTLWVIFWMLQFVAIEVLTSHASPIESWQGQMVTDHWRPAIHSAPVLWWIAFGVWLWQFPHFLFPPLERWLARIVGGG